MQTTTLAAETMAPPGVDITGVWLGVGHAADGKYKNSPYPYPPPFTEKGRELSRFWADPKNNLGVRCLPGGGPAGMMNGSDYFPIEIIQRPEQVTILLELMQQVRRVYMDGRGHPDPDDLEHTWMGHSIGHWEGDTLVVDTVGVKAGALNGSGAAVVKFKTDKDPRMPYSKTLHAIEHIHQIEDGQILEDKITIDDPIVYTRPYTITRYWRRSPDINMMEYICSENLRPQDEGYSHLLEDKSQ